MSSPAQGHLEALQPGLIREMQLRIAKLEGAVLRGSVLTEATAFVCNGPAMTAIAAKTVEIEQAEAGMTQAERMAKRLPHLRGG